MSEDRAQMDAYVSATLLRTNARVMVVQALRRTGTMHPTKERVLAGLIDNYAVLAVEDALRYASEREAIGRAAGREEMRRAAIAIAEGHAGARKKGQSVADAIRALPVDGGKDGAEEVSRGPAA